MVLGGMRGRVKEEVHTSHTREMVEEAKNGGKVGGNGVGMETEDEGKLGRDCGIVQF